MAEKMKAPEQKSEKKEIKKETKETKNNAEQKQEKKVITQATLSFYTEYFSKALGVDKETGMIKKTEKSMEGKALKITHMGRENGNRGELMDGNATGPIRSEEGPTIIRCSDGSMIKIDYVDKAGGFGKEVKYSLLSDQEITAFGKKRQEYQNKQEEAYKKSVDQEFGDKLANL